MLRTSKLIFVYNTQSGVIESLLYSIKKIMSSNDVTCHLYSLTHGTFTMHTQWEAFIKTLPVPVEFLYKDQLEQRFQLEDVELPSAFREEYDIIGNWISQDEIKACQNLQDLIALVKRKLVDVT